MPATLQITKKLAIAPLIDIQGTVFADSYRNGLVNKVMLLGGV
jgi:hypothetical protein